MTTAHDIADKIGRGEIATTVGVGMTAVSNAVVRGKFPASWFIAMQTLCKKHEVECPDELFGFIQPESEKTEAAE